MQGFRACVFRASMSQGLEGSVELRLRAGLGASGGSGC